MRAVLFSLVSSFIISSLSAQSLILPEPDEYDLSSIPPLTTPLLRQERRTRDKENLASIQTLLQKAMSKEKKLGKKKDDKQAKIKSSVDGRSAMPAIPAEILNHLYRQYESQELAGKKVSLHGKNMSIKDAIAMIGKAAGISLIVDTDVTGRIERVKFDDVPLSAALHSLLGSNQPRLALVKDLDILRVTQFPIALEIIASRQARKKEKEFIFSIMTIKNAKWNDQLRDRINKLWDGITQAETDKKNIYIVLDEVNKKIFFRGLKEHVLEFKKSIVEIDLKIPQIRLDARVVIANKDFEESIGFQWSGVYNRRASVKHFDLVGLGPITTAADTASHDFFKDLITWSLNMLPSGAMPTMSIPLVFGNNDLSTKRLNLLLNAAENRTEIKTILKPTLLVHNLEPAEILVGDEVPLEVRLDETVEGKLTNVTTVNYKDVGMKIKVVPMVNSDHDSVFLDIFVENSSLVKPNFREEMVIGTNKSSFNYTVQTARSKNKVLLKSGQTTLIGGLITKGEEDVRTGIPFLQEIPILGFFFRGKRKKKVDKQLLIFITPTLI